mmetsp:Transcript_5664/g.11329  ORF Transcript_5664/g.11329 Transcript_5664/m.11329 type:complete len:401 (+) Transcript_5664:50-1252(+)
MEQYDNTSKVNTNLNSSIVHTELDKNVLKHYKSAAGLTPLQVSSFLNGTTTSPIRYIRLNPRSITTSSPLHHFETSEPVPWLPPSTLFYKVQNRTINNLEPYTDGTIYGMDCGSGAAVAALRLDLCTEPIRVLDLCCCPCAKLCMIVDSLEHVTSSSSQRSLVVGVDINLQRLNVGKKIVRKYLKGSKADVRLYNSDGTTFPLSNATTSTQLVYDTRSEEQETNLGKRKKMNKSALSRERKRLQSLSSSSPPTSIGPYDYVIVDAECSTDGALKQAKCKIKQGRNDATQSIKEKLMEEEELMELQFGLIKNGFDNLKEGGYMVYSTCSLSENQNEGVVRTFLSSHPTAAVVDVDFGLECNPPSVPGTIKGTMRFVPTLNNEEDISTSGFFLCKITKRKKR